MKVSNNLPVYSIIKLVDYEKLVRIKISTAMLIAGTGATNASNIINIATLKRLKAKQEAQANLFITKDLNDMLNFMAENNIDLLLL